MLWSLLGIDIQSQRDSPWHLCLTFQLLLQGLKQHQRLRSQYTRSVLMWCDWGRSNNRIKEQNQLKVKWQVNSIVNSCMVPQVPKKVTWDGSEFDEGVTRTCQRKPRKPCEPGKSIIENLGEIVISIQFKFPLYSWSFMVIKRKPSLEKWKLLEMSFEWTWPGHQVQIGLRNFTTPGRTAYHLTAWNDIAKMSHFTSSVLDVYLMYLLLPFLYIFLLKILFWFGSGEMPWKEGFCLESLLPPAYLSPPLWCGLLAHQLGKPSHQPETAAEHVKRFNIFSKADLCFKVALDNSMPRFVCS